MNLDDSPLTIIICVRFTPFIYLSTTMSANSGKGIYYSKFNNRRANAPLQMKTLGRKLPYDLPLVKRGVSCAKFHRICSYCVQMHEEQTNKQTNKQTFFLIYVHIEDQGVTNY